MNGWTECLNQLILLHEAPLERIIHTTLDATVAYGIHEYASIPEAHREILRQVYQGGLRHGILERRLRLGTQV